MKKKISIALALVLALSLMVTQFALTTSALAENGTFEVSVSNTTASAGDENVVLTLTVDENPGIVSLDMEIEYDTNALEFVSATNGTALSKPTFQDTYTSPFHFTWDDSAALTEMTGTGTLATLTFNVKSTAEAGTYNITLKDGSVECYDFNIDDVDFEFAPGGITVEGAQQETTVAPVEETTAAPVEETTEAPVEETTEAPAEETTEAPAEETTAAPAEETTEASAEELDVNAISNYAVPDNASQTVTVGDEYVTVVYSLPEDCDITSVQFKMTYDSNYLTFTGASTFTTDMMFNTEKTGEVSASVSKIEGYPYTSGSEFATFVFRADNSGETTVDLRIVDLAVKDGDNEEDKFVIIDGVVQQDEPEETTAEPAEETTAAPEETTVASEETTVAPEETTVVPQESTEAPEETTAAPTTAEPTTVEPTTAEPTTVEPTTAEPTTVEPTTVEPTTVEPTTVEPTTVEPTTVEPTTVEPTTVEPTTNAPSSDKEDKKDTNTGVVVENIDKDVNLEVKDVTNDEAAAKDKENLESKGEEVVKGFEVDLTKNSSAYTPDGNVTMFFPSDKLNGGKVYQVGENGQLQEVTSQYNEQKGGYEISATGGGRFYIVQETVPSTTTDATVPPEASTAVVSDGTGTPQSTTVPAANNGGTKSSTSDSTSDSTKGSSNGAVQTGSSNTAFVVFIIMVLSTAIAYSTYFVRKRTKR